MKGVMPMRVDDYTKAPLIMWAVAVGRIKEKKDD